MADLGEIKARVVIEYDGSGLEKAKEDLASLGDVAGTFGEAAGGASEALGGVVGSISELSAPLVVAAKQLTETIAPMQLLSEHAATVVDQVSAVGDSFAAIQDPVGQSILMLPQYAESLHNVGVEAGASQENLAVFQDALQNPYPFSMIQSHLDETGQSWQDFTGSIGDSNTQMLHEMAANADVMHDVLPKPIPSDTVASYQAFTDQFNSMGDAAGGAGKSVAETGGALADIGGVAKSGGGGFLAGMGEDVSGFMGALNAVAMPLMAFQMIGMAVGAVGQGIYNAAAIAEGPAAHSFGSFTGTVDALGQSMQQTAGQFSENFGQSIMPILNALNSQSQGGGMGGIGGFLGGMLSSVANVGQILFGLNPIGGFEGLANQALAFGGAPPMFAGSAPQTPLQQAYGQMPQTVQSATMQLQIQSATTLAETLDPAYLAAQDQLTASQQLAARRQQSYNISHPVSQQQLLDNAQQQAYDQQQAQLIANRPTYGQEIWGDLMHGNWMGGEQLLQQATGTSGFFQGVGNFFNGAMGGMGDLWNSLFGGGGGQGPKGNVLGELWNSLFGGSGQATEVAGGCFVAGTCVLMADGTHKAIETLQVGERIQGRDGVVASIQAHMAFPDRQVYTLTFSDGKTLTLTAGHPLFSPLQGWRSLSPEQTHKENPELAVTKLEIDDSIHTINGAVTLLSITPTPGLVPVYNITVDGPHTFYANGVLVHNKIHEMQQNIGDQISQTLSSIQLPHIDFSGIQSSLSGAFSHIELPHIDLGGITSSLSGMFSGIHLPSLDLSGITSSLGSMFSGIHLPPMPDFAGTISQEMGSLFSGIHLPSLPDVAGQIGSELGGLFSGIHLPSLPDLAGSISQELGSLFSGIKLPSLPDIAGDINSAMSNMFSGIHLPSLPDIAGSINSALSSLFSGISGSIGSIPGFAAGVENFEGGLAYVHANELISLPRGSSVYPLSTGAGVGGSITPISLGAGAGSGGPQSVNVIVNLDSAAIIQQMGLPLAQSIRLSTGNRGY